MLNDALLVFYAITALQTSFLTPLKIFGAAKRNGDA